VPSSLRQQSEEEPMFGSKGSRWFVLSAFMIVCASRTGAVGAGPVPEPPTCITVLPAITTECPSRSQPQTSHVASAESGQSLGIGIVSAVAAPGAYGGRDVQIAAAKFGLRRP
jgi:hypothetical protein